MMHTNLLRDISIFSSLDTIVNTWTTIVSPYLLGPFIFCNILFLMNLFSFWKSVKGCYLTYLNGTFNRIKYSWSIEPTENNIIIDVFSYNTTLSIDPLNSIKEAATKYVSLLKNLHLLFKMNSSLHQCWLIPLYTFIQLL